MNLTPQIISMLVIPILTILMSGVIASVVTFKLNARLQRRDFMRGKLEELYTSLHGYCNGLRGYFLIYISVFREKLDMNQANDLTIEHTGSTDSDHFKNVQMLIGLYFPHLQEEFDALIQSRDTLNSIIRRYRHAYDVGDTDGRSLLPSYQTELSNLNRMEERLKKSLMAEARRFR
jgi:hypothetical protein